ncbi:TPA: hypothetical protein IX699_000304 [Enterococcus faecium]|uniref:hypothetical protein n=1 Tax=Enterococcus faecium TaxID=1352 RepID=UPI0002A3A37F|nr:hypothetical protein [Enterococcus faecium]ELB81156.1 hypothetical protein OMC_05320 [Enterococcus faecium EnGen0049]ELB81983.1 hypothetical protein OMA_04949 [Enterococcus faecium EnGen0045]MWG19277.1 hypothetical protein [Enterococcus faecium]HAQ6362176.1 hypothetical protein [Enterococcus faecium]HAQ6778956.1 hypothetical protein [Enterococcus faecium]
MEKNTPYQVGDIFYSSWGDEQTNVTFWQIVRLTEKTAWFQPIQKKTVEHYSSMSGKVVPMKDKFMEYPLAKTKDSIVKKRIDPESYPDMLCGFRSWDTFHRYKDQAVYESSYY